jgi:cytochrome c2
MPTYQGLLSEREIDGIIAYLKSISDVESIE